MKKHYLIAAGLLAVSPLVLAQATPATPATPANDTLPSATPPDVDVTTPKGDSSATVKKGKNAATVTGNPDTKSGSAHARSGASKGDFAAFDANGDGSLSQDEANAAGGINFTRADKNHDGMLSSGEYQAAISGSSKSSKSKDNSDSGGIDKP